MQRLTLVTTAMLLIGATSMAQESDREVDPRYTWDLTELYSSVDEWNEAREKVLLDLQKIDARRGTLGDSADSLYRTLELVSDTTRDALRVYAYGSLASDEDLRVTDTQERKQLGDIMFARFTEATAWIQPDHRCGTRGHRVVPARGRTAAALCVTTGRYLAKRPAHTR